MGLIDKIKNLFSDEIEEDVKPVKKEVIQVEIPSPMKEDVVEKDITESDAIKKDEKFVFPVYFDDKDFDTLDYKPKVEPPKPSGYTLNKPASKEEKKVFKPSPIISPVYGVLDKNYSKDDIVTKQNRRVEKYQTLTRQITIDDVRKKAYGTLEEELETELFSQNSMLFNDNVDEEPVETEKDLFEELEEAHSDTSSRRVIEEKITLEMFEDIPEINDSEEDNEVNMIENELDKMFDEDDTLNEGDLFNLIDSMYEKGEDN